MYFGCGFQGMQGQAQAHYERGATAPPYNRTCPRWCWLQPAVQEVFTELRDYERGALGNVHDLEPQFLDLLRVAEIEREAWKAEQDRQMDESEGSDV